MKSVERVEGDFEEGGGRLEGAAATKPSMRHSFPSCENRKKKKKAGARIE